MDLQSLQEMYSVLEDAAYKDGLQCGSVTLFNQSITSFSNTTLTRMI